MKKFGIFFLFLALMVGPVLTSPAAAETIVAWGNNTLVRPYTGLLIDSGFNGGNWTDEIGATNGYKSFGAQLIYDNTSVKLYLYTNFGGPDKTDWLTPVADLFLKVDSTNFSPFDTAVRLRVSDFNIAHNPYWTGLSLDLNHEADTNKDIGDALSSVNLMNGNKGWTYGGRYGGKEATNDGLFVPVQVKDSVTSDATTSVKWEKGPFTFFDGKQFVSGVQYKVTVNLTGILDPTEDYSGIWATGTCANDTIEFSKASGFVVPLPGAVLLLGAGLARLVGYARRQRSLS